MGNPQRKLELLPKPEEPRPSPISVIQATQLDEPVWCDLLWRSTKEICSDYGPDIVGTISLITVTFATAFWGINKESHLPQVPTWKVGYFRWIIFACLLHFFSLLMQNRRSKSKSAFKRELKTLKHESTRLRDECKVLSEKVKNDYLYVFKQELGLLSMEIGLDSNARISIYKFNKGLFVLQGRYSLREEFGRFGRSSYPSNQGVIGKAWSDGEFICQDLPSYTKNPEEYLKASYERFNMPPDVCKNLAMKSRSIGGFALCDSYGTTRVAIIVVESINPNGVPIEKIREVLIDTTLTMRLRFLVETLDPSAPNAHEAAEAEL